MPPATGSLRQTGIFGPAAPARLRQLRTACERTPEEVIDRHQLACQPVRDLLVDYLRERQPAMDYGSLEQLARKLGGCSGPTWSTIIPASTACT